MAKLNVLVGQEEEVNKINKYITWPHTDVDFISDHFTVFWREWLNIFLKLILRYAVDSVILLFIKSQAMKTQVE